MISLRVPAGSPSRGSWKSLVKRSSTVMSGLLRELDSVFWTVRDREAGLAVLARRHGSVADDLPEALVVIAEQVGREVVAAAMSLAAPGIDLNLHLGDPVCGVLFCAGARGQA